VRTCSMHGRDEIHTLKRRDHSEDLDVEGQIMLERILGK
jgi:hypothetical protein